MRIPATDGLVCPHCQGRNLMRETTFVYTAEGPTEDVDHYEYSCEDCEFVFQVQIY